MSAALSNEEQDRPAHVSAAEWHARRELAACYRIFDHLGWTELIFNHITLRIPGAEDQFLINPFGLTYREVRASNLVKIDLEGRVVGDAEHPVNRAGFVIHSAFHEAVPDAKCVMHVHTTAGMAVACSREGLVDCNFYSAQLHDHLAYHDFEGISLRPDEKQRFIADLGDCHAMILRNHGLLTIGVDVAQALAFMWTLQRACEVQIAARALGEVIRVPPSISRQARSEAFQFDPSVGAARMMFDALVRAVDATDPSFWT